MPRTCWRPFVAVAALVAAGGGCDWRELDKLADQAPVLSIGAPGDFGPKDDFGRVVAPIAAPSETEGVAARFVVSGVSGTGLALIELDGSGKANARNIKAPALSALEGYSLASLAEIPGPKPGQVLAGAPVLKDVVGGQLLVVTLGEAPAVSRFDTSTETGFGLGVAAASLDAVGAATPDYVIASGDSLRVYVDGAVTGALPVFASSGACPISLMATRTDSMLPLNRPLLVDHWVGAGSDSQVAVGTPAGPAGKGSVSLFSVSGAALTCLQTLTGNEPAFGASVATGDFNGDGVRDLLIGAPPGSAYVYFGPLGPGATPVSLPADANPRAFGAAVAAIDVNGQGGDEAVVSDPKATVKGADQSGAAQIFSFTATTPGRLTTLAPYSPTAGSSYGVTVNALPFCTTRPCSATNQRRLVLIGAGASVFTYFRLVAGDTDPRQP